MDDEPIIIPDAAIADFEAREARWSAKWVVPVDDLPDDLPPALRAFLDDL